MNIKNQKKTFKETLNEYVHLMIKRTLKVILHVYWVFPVNENRISLINEMSFSYGDNVKYLNEYISENLDNYDVIFPVKDRRKKAPNAIYVKPKSFKYFKYLLTSKVIITNADGLFSYLPKRKNQIFINSWHGGGAYKKVGKDVNISNNKIICKEKQMSAVNTDFFCCACEAFGKYTGSALLLKPEKLIKTGMPRNDIFFQSHEKTKYNVYKTLCLKNDEKLIIYAPTFRSKTTSFVNRSFVREVDIDYEEIICKLEEKFGGKWRFAIRFHPGVANTKFEDTSIINCSHYPDTQELLYACDAVITDYSSLMWDYSLTYRPCFLYAPDIDEYERDRGFYVSPSEWPFPIARTNDELINKISAFDDAEYKKQVRLHHEMLGSYEDGNACQRVMDLINKKD